MSRRPDKGRGTSKPSPEAYMQLLLSRGAWTKALAVRKLLDRGVPEETARRLVEKYEQAGFFDDAAYALLFVDTHPEWGPRRLRYELVRRGVDDDDIMTALEEVDEEERARSLARDWLSSGLEASRVEQRLLRRGFSPSASRRAVRPE